MGVQLVEKSNAWKGIKATLEKAKKAYVAVGWPGEANQTKAPHDIVSGMSNVQVATVNELGSAPGVRPQVPARPMVKETMRRIEAPAKKLTAEMFKQVTEGRMSVELALGRIGRYAQGELIESIRMPAGDWKASNAPSTIARKKSETPLVNTGKMSQSVSYKVRMKGTP